MMNKNILKICIALPVLGAALVSCNKEWVEEQYEHYISFATPLDYTAGTSSIYVSYKEDGNVTYKVPVIVSGSTEPDSDMDIRVKVDKDTLALINDDHFKQRADLYYKELPSSFYSLGDATVHIPAGEYQGTLDVNFSLKGIDLTEKWVLPLMVDDENASYTAHPRKDYAKAILRVIPFNKYSGKYNATTMNVYMGNETTNAICVTDRTLYVVDGESVFFYAGLTDEELTTSQRNRYKIIVRFEEDYDEDGMGNVFLSAADPSLNLRANGKQTYEITERKDALQPYLVHRYVTLRLNYYYDDFTTYSDKVLTYHAKGSMMTERKINTQIPDEDQAIDW